MIKNWAKYKLEKKILFVVVVRILCAIICRLISMYDIVDDGLNYLSSLLRTGIYIGIIVTWGISVQNRILNDFIKRCMLTVAGLLLFWFVVRSLKFHFTDGIVPFQYYCWYSYYIPLILIPLMGILLLE